MPPAPARFVVSTRCPSCGGPLDFAEASTVVACRYCDSRLLVTGRGQVLAYVVRPRVNGREAAAIAAAAAPPPGAARRLGEPQLHFVPFYRLVAGELRWEVHEPGRTPGHGPGELPQQVRSVVGKLALAWATSSPEPRDARMPELHLVDRWIEKSFVAGALPDLGLYSLGVRSGVLALELFERETVTALGRIARVDVTVDEAMRRGLMTPAVHHVLHREVVGRVLSLVYFPFWVVPAATGGPVVIDGVSRQVVAAAADAELLGRLARDPDPPPPTLGFRSLACPNCGWNLPLAAEEIIAHCGPCGRAWQIVADRLEPVPFDVARPNGMAAPRDVVHLPVWILDDARAARRLFAPAFRYRRLGLLNELAARLLRRQPRWEPWLGVTPPLRGCALDAADGTRMARVAAVGVHLEREVQRRGAAAIHAVGDAADAPEGRAARLTWLPFVPEPYALRETATGAMLPKGPLG